AVLHDHDSVLIRLVTIFGRCAVLSSGGLLRDWGRMVLPTPAEVVAQRHQGHDLLADLDRRPPLDPVDLTRANLDDLIDMVQGNGIDLLEDPHQQAGHDGQGQGKADGERGPLARARADIDAAAQVLDPVLDDVHADAPSRDLGDRLGGAQAGVPDERDELAIGELLGLGRANQILGDDLAADSLAVDPTAVVAHGDDHAIAAVRGLQPHRACAGLAGRFTKLGRFQTMIDRVADHVNEWVAQLVDHPLVQLGLLPLIWSRTSLPEERLRSRMTRRNRSNRGPIGTIRVSRTPFWRPSVTRPRLWMASASVLSCSRPSRSRVSSS